MDDEELAAGGIGDSGARHGDDAANVVYAVRMTVSRKLALYAVAGAAGSVALGVAALDHKALYDPVEYEPVIKAGICKGDEVRHGVGRDFGIELDLDGLAVIHLNCCYGICHFIFLLSSAAFCRALRFYLFRSLIVRSISRSASRLAELSRLS